jgi:hypothetical protein
LAAALCAAQVVGRHPLIVERLNTRTPSSSPLLSIISSKRR